MIASSQHCYGRFEYWASRSAPRTVPPLPHRDISFLRARARPGWKSFPRRAAGSVAIGLHSVFHVTHEVKRPNGEAAMTKPEFLSRVQRSATLSSPKEAERWTVAVLRGLSHMLP